VSQRRYIVSQNLIAANVERISAVSWHGYQQAGRGVVLIDGEAVDEKRLQIGPLTYVSDTEAQEERGGWPTQEVGDVLQVYDPEQEVVVMVRWRDGIGVYRFKSPVTPPAAYERLKENFL
jgi:hypothetical protein